MNDVKLQIALAAVAALVIGAIGGYWVAQRPGEKAQAEAGPGARQQGERRILYWHDPMVPNTRFDKPGKSPFMDMPLVPVYADEQPDAAVQVSPAVTQNLGIRLGAVEKAALTPKLTVVGSVAFDERLVEVVQARVEGYVTRLDVKSAMTQVRRSQPLAEIVAPAWLEAQEEYLALRDAQSDRGKSIKDAARRRLTVLGMPEATLRQLDAEGKVNASTTILSPIDGVITELSVREGAAFMPGAALFRVNGLESVWVNAQVPEAQVSMVPTGSSVSARATAWPGTTFKGHVVALLPSVDPQTRTLAVRIAIDNPDFKLAPGMFVSIDLEGRAEAPRLVVPSEAVIVTGERSIVVVAREGGGFDIAEVTTGPESAGKTAILDGLEEGQTVVLSGQFLIDSEASLKSAVSRLSTSAEARPKP
jgi:Cu(I)/Ag(I) efflux system membrane fusion protein